MKKSITACLLIILSTSALLGQMKKVQVTYNEPETYVVFNDDLVGVCPDFIKLDFAIGGELVFFKQGYYSYRIEIDPDTPFSKLAVELVKRPSNTALDTKRLLNPDTLVISSIVTNMTAKKIQEIIDNNFIKNNYYIGKSADLFPGAIDEIENCRYKIAIEIVDSEQLRRVYKAPRFAMAFIKIRWSLLDSESNKVVYFNATDGIYFVKVSKTKGMVVSELMERVMKGAIKEAQIKLLTDEKFISLINE